MLQINQQVSTFARFYLFAHFPLLPAGFFLCFSSVTPNAQASRQTGHLLAFLFQFSTFGHWSNKRSCSIFPPG
jgi:hypothetical protein